MNAFLTIFKKTKYKPEDFKPEDILGFKEFIMNEYKYVDKYVDKYPHIYKNLYRRRVDKELNVVENEVNVTEK